ncbi:MAG: HNH endonuclease [Actinomyces sp.]|nr:MAG: HNH endonuclease [Actinomyces sp.]
MGEPIFVLRGKDNAIFEELRQTRDPSLMVNWVFWNFWKRRLFPFQTIEEGQTLYFVDLEAREIGVELRVSGVAPLRYEDPVDPYRILDRVFGIGSDQAEEALRNRKLPVPGYLLAVAADPVAYIGEPIDLDWSKVGGRAGWAAWTTVLESEHTPPAARRVLENLPPEGRPLAARSYPIDLGAVTHLAEMPRAPRQPTAAVARLVRERSGGICEVPGCTAPAEHLDHIYPWVHGGNSEAVNLQWLCAKHNLEKSDRIPDTYSPDQLWLRYVSDLEQGEITFGADLAAHVIRTHNSVYHLVIDDDICLLWKRGGREIYVARFDGIDSVIVPYKGGRRIELFGSPDFDEPPFRTSPILDITAADGIETLSRLGRRPGDTVPLVSLV